MKKLPVLLKLVEYRSGDFQLHISDRDEDDLEHIFTLSEARTLHRRLGKLIEVFEAYEEPPES